MRALKLTAITDRLAKGASSAAELMQALQVSQTTISRGLRELEGQQRVVRMGSTRGARYALRKPIATIGSKWPLYRIDEEGTPHELGALTAIHRDS
jgi:DeoR/GlpR family transcriptional regulator of sugar metabolism